MCNAPRFRQGGSGANKPPRWSAERRASPGAQTVKASLRGDARAYVTGPLTYGCRCTRAPVGAPLPSLARGELAKLGGDVPRENDDVCVDFVARVERSETRDSSCEPIGQPRISP